MNLEHATPDLFAALSKAQLELENATKNAANPHFRSKYADLAEVLNTVRPALAKHGLCVIQGTRFDGAMVSVTTTLAHAGGGYVTEESHCVPAKTDAQGIGSATTYLRRYALSAIAGIAQEDDDGQTAAHNAAPARAAPKPAKAAYPDDQFGKNFPKWQEMIESGQKTAEEIIHTVETRAVLTEDMKTSIRDCAGEKA